MQNIVYTSSNDVQIQCLLATMNTMVCRCRLHSYQMQAPLVINYIIFFTPIFLRPTKSADIPDCRESGLYWYISSNILITPMCFLYPNINYTPTDSLHKLVFGCSGYLIIVTKCCVDDKNVRRMVHVSGDNETPIYFEYVASDIL